jgi:salicylate hydroxylase
LINFLAAVEGPEGWTAPAWMEQAEPGAHLAPFAGGHPAVTEMIGAVPRSPRCGLFALRRWSRGPVVMLGDLAYYDQGSNQFAVAPGHYTVIVGTSSPDLHRAVRPRA